jgi:hypothetical protein
LSGIWIERVVVFRVAGEDTRHVGGTV